MIQKLATNYTAFNAWANTKIAEWLNTVDEKLLYAQVQSSFTSIDYTLQHMLRTQRYWQMFIMEEDTSKMNWSVRENEVGKILEELIAVSNEMKNNFAKFDTAALEAELHLDTSWAKNQRCRYEYIIHVVNHSSFHRGQLVTIARGLGIVDGIPNTDYNMFNSL